MRSNVHYLSVFLVGIALFSPAQAFNLQDAIERVFGKVDQRLATIKAIPFGAEVKFEIKEPYGAMEFLLNAAGVEEAGSNAAEPNGLIGFGVVDLDADGIEELVLLFNTSMECTSQGRCLTLVYKPQDASKKKYRRVFSGITQLRAGDAHYAVSRGVGKMRAIESRKDGRVVDRFEP